MRTRRTFLTMIGAALAGWKLPRTRPANVMDVMHAPLYEGVTLTTVDELTRLYPDMAQLLGRATRSGEDRCEIFIFNESPHAALLRGLDKRGGM